MFLRYCSRAVPTASCLGTIVRPVGAVNHFHPRSTGLTCHAAGAPDLWTWVLGCFAESRDTVLSWADDHTVRRWRISVSVGTLDVIELPERPSARTVLADARIVVGTVRGRLFVVEPGMSGYRDRRGSNGRSSSR